MTRALEAARKQVVAFGQYTAKIGLGVAGAGAAMLTPITKVFTDAVNEGADVSKLSKRWRMTAESVSTLKGAFSQAGVGAEEFASSMDSFGDKIAAAATANDELIQGLQGLRGVDLLGKTKEEQLDAFADAFKRIVHAEDQVRVASEFGFLPLLENLKKGSAGMRELREAAIANGDAMSGEQAQQAAEINREFNRTLLALKSTLLEVGKALIPTGASFSSVGADIRDGLSSVREWIRDNKQIVVAVTAAAGALFAGGAAVAAFGAAATAIAPIISGLAIAVKALVFTYGLLFNPITWIVIASTAAATGLAYLWSQTEHGTRVLGELKAAAGDVVKWFQSGFAAIGDAFKAGEWSLAFKIGIAMAREAWSMFVYGLTATWVDFNATFVDGWKEVTTWLAKTLTNVGAFVMRNTLGAMKKLIDGYNSIAGALDDSLKVNIDGLLSDDQINAARDDILKEIDKDHARGQAERDKFREDQVANAQRDWDEAWKALDDLKKEAAEAGAKQYGGLFNRIAKIPRGTKQSAAGPPSMQALAEQARGTFSSAAVQQSLGYGDQLGQRQLDAANNTARNTAAAVTVMEQIRDKPGAVYK